MPMKRVLKLLITFVPLIVLIFMSAYFAKKSWDEYQKNKLLYATLTNVKLLQAYESALLQETLCKMLVPKESKEVSKICEARMKKSTLLEKKLTQQDENLDNWIRQIKQIKENSNSLDVENFEKLLGTDHIQSSVQSYLEQVAFKTDRIEEKELLHTYGLLSNILYATNIENFLVTYYITKHKPVSVSNMIFWDKIIEASYPPNFKSTKHIASVKNQLILLSQSKEYQTLLHTIDDMRIQILTGDIKQNKNTLQWVKNIEKKSTILTQMTTLVAKELDLRIKQYIKESLQEFILYISILLLSIIALLYLAFDYKKRLRESTALVKLVNRIQALDPYSNTASNNLQETLETLKDKEDIYTYIYEYFKLLNQRCKKAEQEAESKNHFLSTLSHEIRTPLNGIIGFSKLLKDIGVSPDQEEFLSLIEGSSHNLIAIVNDVLDLSKINADKMEIENVSFDIFETVESTVATFTQKAVQKDIELGVFIDPFLSHYFLGDATKLSQILTNLIGNAVKFTNPYGKINIYVQSMHHNDDEAEIKFSVTDDGIGLAEEQIENIFNPFTQATKSTSRKYGGTGLGLTISRKMVELMGGTLEVKSQPDQGANFFFTLTLQKDKNKTFEPYPHFEDTTVGLALPVRSIKRQLDTNLKIYLEYLGAKFKLYYYDELFENKEHIELPDIMVFDHHYARLAGELEQCSSLACKTVILTDGSLYARINPNRHKFDGIIFTPLSLSKTIRILENTQKEEQEVYTKASKTLENVTSFTGLHALVADDNLINRKLINIILEKIGLKVTLASDGQDALNKYKQTPFDIIFMDIQMPVMDGVDATRSIINYEKENNLSHVPIIALTANVAPEDKEFYLSEGMDDYATKPLEINVLKSLIAKHCEVSLPSEDKKQ